MIVYLGSVPFTDSTEKCMGISNMLNKDERAYWTLQASEFFFEAVYTPYWWIIDDMKWGPILMNWIGTSWEPQGWLWESHREAGATDTQHAAAGVWVGRGYWWWDEAASKRFGYTDFFRQFARNWILVYAMMRNLLDFWLWDFDSPVCFCFCFFWRFSNQLIVNWWFGLVVGILGVPLSNNLFHHRIPGIQTTTPKPPHPNNQLATNWFNVITALVFSADSLQVVTTKSYLGCHCSLGWWISFSCVFICFVLYMGQCNVRSIHIQAHREWIFCHISLNVVIHIA